MKKNDLNNIKNMNNDFSNNSLEPNSHKILSSSNTINYINKLNNKENNQVQSNNNNNFNNVDNCKQNYINNFTQESFIKKNNLYNEKPKSNNSNFYEIRNINSGPKIKNTFVKKTPLQNFLQSGYKKFPKAKNQRLLIQHFLFWEGYNYFPYNGHILEGPCSFRPTMATGIAISLPIGLFIGFNAKYITNHWTKSILIIAGVLCILDLIFLIICSFKDPGILRRNHYSGFFRFDRKISKIFQLGLIRNYKYCGTCSIMRPIRSSHCIDCNNCVEKCDHHCPWVGNCIGKRNYIYFYLFIITMTFMLLYMEGFCIAHIWKYLYDNINENDFKKSSEKKEHIVAYSLCDVIISLYLVIYGICCLGFTLGLLFYHTKLILTNTTTKEILKFLWNNPFGNFFNRKWDYNLVNSLIPEIKKYSILDILRNGKKINIFTMRERQRFIEQQYNNNISKNISDFSSSFDINNSISNDIGDLKKHSINNSMEKPLSLKNKKIKNIDSNIDMNDFIKEKKNYNNYLDLTINTFNNSFYEDVEVKNGK